MTASPLAPIAGAERIQSLDVVRGFALLGILLMNIVVMGLPFATYMNPMAAGPISEADRTAWFITHSFFEGSMRTLFSMLFGAGFLILMERLEARSLGVAAAKIYLRRTLFLLLFGVIDVAVLLWAGDILIGYAIAALFLPVFFRAKLRGLILWAAVLFAMATFFGLGGAPKFAAKQAAFDSAIAAQAQGQTLDESQFAAIRAWRDSTDFWKMSAADKEKVDERMAGGWGAVAAYNVGQLFAMPMGFFLFFTIIDALAAMLLGMIAFRIGLMQGRWPLPAILGLTLVGFGLGAPLNLWETNTIIASGFTIHGFMETQGTYHVGRVLLALGWLGVALLISRLRIFALVSTALSAVGRMALTNYLAHSLIAAVLFVGLGRFGDFSRAELYLVVLGMWAFNIAFSLAWLSVFRMGPLEWLWRAGTYGAWPPLLRKRGETGAAAAEAA